MSAPIVSVTEGLQQLSQRDLYLMYERWIGGMPPARDAELVSNLVLQMSNPFAVAEARSRIYGDMLPIFKVLRSAEGMVSHQYIADSVSEWKMPPAAVVDCLRALVATGLVAKLHALEGKPLWGVTPEIELVLDYSPRPSSGTLSPLALYGWLHQYLCTKVPRTAVDAAAQNMFGMLSLPTNIASRIESLASEMRELLTEVITKYGGLITKDQFENEFANADLFAFHQALEKASLGCLTDLNLEGHGLRHNASTLVVLHEVVLHVLENADDIDDEDIFHSVSVGTDFVASYLRFSSHLQNKKIRFTTKGAIYKTTGKRLAEDFLLPESKELSKFEMLELEFHFARDTKLIIGGGDGNFVINEKGEQFLRRDLLEKQRLMLDWMIEEYSLSGDMSHQIRMRRSTLLFLKNLKPGRWYDAMHLPYIVRNHHFSLLTSGQVSPLQNGSFPVRASSDARELSWNLLLWLRKDLHLLGIIDLAYNDNDVVSAIRLSSIGSELLGQLSLKEKRQTGHIVVNPDFEIVLFPLIASHRLIYTLDCFCDRERTDSLYHFRLNQKSVERAMAGGFTHDDILAVLTRNSRTPLPQNVCYELRSWANA
jgi:hypothetical protein